MSLECELNSLRSGLQHSSWVTFAAMGRDSSVRSAQENRQTWWKMVQTCWNHSNINVYIRKSQWNPFRQIGMKRMVGSACLRAFDHQITHLPHRSTSLSQEFLLVIPIIRWNMEKSRGSLSVFRVWMGDFTSLGEVTVAIEPPFQSISGDVPLMFKRGLTPTNISGSIHQFCCLKISFAAWSPSPKEGQTQSSSSGGQSHACVQEWVIPQNCKF